MSEIATTQLKSETMEKALIGGNLNDLSSAERLSYYNSVCQSVGLNPLTQPFQYITLNGKLTLYAKRDATDQLRKIHQVSIKIVGREKVGNVYVVTAQATDKTGRIDEATGAVALGNLQGDAMANALMKAETKAKRRVTLSICGLGMLDETEIETIPQAMRVNTEPVKPAPMPQIPTTEDREQRVKAMQVANEWSELFAIVDTKARYNNTLNSPRLQTIKTRMAECGYDDLIEQIDAAARAAEERLKAEPVPA